MVLAPLQSDLSALAEGVNMMWVLTVTFLIFFMHAGFAMLESGQVRSKNVANQLTKNLLTWAVGVVAFFFVGSAVSTLVGAYTGGAELESFGAAWSSTIDGGSSDWVSWLFGAVFAMTAATIVSGAVAGRAKLRAYVTYTFVLAAVIYPVVTGLTWGGGLLAPEQLFEAGFQDFAGGYIVHAVGGIAGLTAAWILGPRIDRYNEDGSVNVIPGHSMTFAVLGTLVLAFGWYGFNVGTAATVVTADGTSLGAFSYVGRVALATTLGMALGALGSAGVSLLMTNKVDTLYVANGLLAGLVGVTGVANQVTWIGAMIIAFVAGAQLPLVFRFVERRLKIDDVCAVFPVHGSAGAVGILLIPLFTVDGTPVLGGLFSVDLGLFAPQIAGVVVITAWAVLATAAVWGAFRAIGQARVTPDHERDGLDISEHGVDTYPEFGSELAADGGSTAGPADAYPEEQLRSDGGERSGGSRASSELRSDGGEDAYATDIEMVMAYVRPDRLSDVKRGLAEAGAPSLTVTNVSGRGSQPAKTGQWRGDEYVVDLHQKVKIECVVADIPTEDVVDAIREAAHTGEPGDGKVFVLPVSDALQVRTGKRGPDAV